MLQQEFYGTRCRILIGQDILTSGILIKRFYCSHSSPNYGPNVSTVWSIAYIEILSVFKISSIHFAADKLDCYRVGCR